VLSNLAVMANADGQSRPSEEDEGVPLLQATSDREPSPHLVGVNTRRPSWFAPLRRVYHATTIEMLLWVFVPLGLVSGAFSWTSILTSIFNFLAIIPLSAAVSDFSDTLSQEFGDLLGALINATFGNAVELIVILLLLHYFARD
jgi:Ca2+:H+ antiporter